VAWHAVRAFDAAGPLISRSRGSCVRFTSGSDLSPQGLALRSTSEEESASYRGCLPWRPLSTRQARCRFLARSCRPGMSAIRSLTGVDRTWRGQPNSVEIDPKPTSDQRNCLDWQQARLGFQLRTGPLTCGQNGDFHRFLIVKFPPATPSSGLSRASITFKVRCKQLLCGKMPLAAVFPTPAAWGKPVKSRSQRVLTW